MKLEQLRYLAEAADRNFNFSEVARVIYRSQSVISRQIQMLEEELGFEVLERRGKRILGLTRDGETVLAIARRMLRESDELRRFAEDRSNRGDDKLTIATTHFHARYTLLDPILRFRKLRPHVLLKLRQCDPTEIQRLVDGEEVDLGVTSQSPNPHSEVVSIPLRCVPRIVIAPPQHPLLAEPRLTLQQLAAYPLIVYDERYSSGRTVKEAFQASGLKPRIVVTAMDADVIKAYVAAGLGVAMVQADVYSRSLDPGLRAIDAAHLFEPLAIVIIAKPRLYLNRAMADFASTLTTDLDASRIEAALRGQ